jgi:acetylornithine deacetylase
MGRILSRLEQLDRDIQCRNTHPVLGSGSLHASIISGGRELSTYPDECTLQIERRTITGEQHECALTEIRHIIRELGSEDPDFKASAKTLFSRPPYELDSTHELPQLMEESLVRKGRKPQRGAVTFWTDAAVLGGAGIPAIVFGPGGAGLHSVSEYVLEEDVATCRDALISLARDFCVR